MSALDGTRIYAPITRPSSDSPYAAQESNQGLGGFHCVANIAARDAMPTWFMLVGMRCDVADAGSGTPKLYRLASLSPVSWVEDGGGTPAGVVLTDQTTGQTIGTSDHRLTKLYVTDLDCTNAITGTVSKATNLVGGNTTTLLGAIPYQSGVDTTTLLSPNTSTTKKWLSQTGDGTNGAAPAWSTIGPSDVGAEVAGTMTSHLGAYTHSDIALNTAARHVAATVSGNGIGISGQELSLSIGTGATQVAAGNHTHSYEPGLGNPDVDGKVLSSTAAGVRSWIAIPATGANAALSNLASVAINASLLPGTSGAVDLGSASKTWGALYLPVTTSATSGVINVGGNVYWNTFSGSVADTCLFLGKDTGNYTHTGYNLVGIGGLNLQSVTSGYNIFALGRAACQSVTEGMSLFGFGVQALTSATSAFACLAIGNQSLATITTSASNQNTAIGTYALMNGAVLADVTAIGAACAVDIGTSSSSRGTYIGSECTRYGVKEVESVIIGYRARYAGTWTSSNYNTCIGSSSMRANVYGYLNTALGWCSGYSSGGTEIYCSTFLGAQSGYTGPSNSVCVGYQAGYYETAANKLFIDNTARASEADGRVKALVYGVFAAAVNDQSLCVNGVFFPLSSTTAAAPTYAEGAVYYDTTLHRPRFGTASAWVSCLMVGDAPTAHAASHAVDEADSVFPTAPVSTKYLACASDGTLSWDASSGTTAWNAITNPSGNLALTMGAYTSTWTYTSGFPVIFGDGYVGVGTSSLTTFGGVTTAFEVSSPSTHCGVVIDAYTGKYSSLAFSAAGSLNWQLFNAPSDNSLYLYDADSEVAKFVQGGAMRLNGSSYTDTILGVKGVNNHYVARFYNVGSTGGQNYGVRIHAGSGTSDLNLYCRNALDDTTFFAVDGAGNNLLGVGNPSRGVTDGLPNIPMYSGVIANAPNGTPSAFSGYAPMLVQSDTSGNSYKVWFYVNGAWRGVAIA
jgi:hypothetical protein